jgi:GT2 family glycosyltransferase
VGGPGKWIVGRRWASIGEYIRGAFDRMVTEPLYSVVIPTFDRRTILAHTLNALAEQADAPPFEAIVVDDGSGDGTADWLARHNFPHPFRHHVQDNRGPAAARNAGVAMASGRFVAFLGDDTAPAADWLAAHHAARSDGDRDDKVAVIGRTDWHPELRITPFLRYLNEQGKQFGFAIIENPADVPFNFFYASNLSLPRGLLIEQPFDESFRHALWEDIELGYRLARLGMRIVYAAGANAHHRHPTSFERFADRQERAGHAAVALSRKHPELCGFLGLGPAGPPQAPARWRRRMVQSMARASADGPGILAPLWDAALEMQYLLGLHRGWVDASSPPGQ